MSEVHEIAEGVYRIATFVPVPIPGGGLTFNQYLIVDEKPLLFHTGQRMLFPQTLEAIKKVIDPAKLRYISWSHFEADECGALNEFLQIAPQAEPVCGFLGAVVNINDFALRPPKTVNDNEVLDLGRRKVRYLITPHTPHAWDAILAYEETQGILLASDLFTVYGQVPPTTVSDPVEPAMAADAFLRKEWGTIYLPIGPWTTATFDRLEALKPKVAACMHGSAFTGDVVQALRDLRQALFATVK